MERTTERRGRPVFWDVWVGKKKLARTTLEGRWWAVRKAVLEGKITQQDADERVTYTVAERDYNY